MPEEFVHPGYRNPEPKKLKDFYSLNSTHPVLWLRLHTIQCHKNHRHQCSTWVEYKGDQLDGEGRIVGVAYSGSQKEWKFSVRDGVLQFAGVKTNLRKHYCKQIYGTSDPLLPSKEAQGA